MKSALLGILLGIILTGFLIFLTERKNVTLTTKSDLSARSYIINKITPVKRKNLVLTVPILNYHYIRVNPDDNDKLGFALSVTPDEYKNQLELLTAMGYQTITLDDLYLALQNKKKLPAKPIILTFDDGYKDFYQAAFPVLKQYNMKAVAYIVSDFIDRADGRYLSSQDILELDQSGLVTIGSHSKTHANLTNLDLVKLKNEIYLSKKNIERLLGHKIDHFCYPSGKWNETVVALIKTAGFKTATTTQDGISHSFSQRLTLTRIRISGGLTLEQFAKRLEGGDI